MIVSKIINFNHHVSNYQINLEFWWPYWSIIHANHSKTLFVSVRKWLIIVVIVLCLFSSVRCCCIFTGNYYLITSCFLFFMSFKMMLFNSSSTHRFRSRMKTLGVCFLCLSIKIIGSFVFMIIVCLQSNRNVYFLLVFAHT